MADGRSMRSVVGAGRRVARIPTRCCWETGGQDHVGASSEFVTSRSSWASERRCRRCEGCLSDLLHTRARRPMRLRQCEAPRRDALGMLAGPMTCAHGIIRIMLLRPSLDVTASVPDCVTVTVTSAVMIDVLNRMPRRPLEMRAACAALDSLCRSHGTWECRPRRRADGRKSRNGNGVPDRRVGSSAAPVRANSPSRLRRRALV